ncbi:MAG TPA: response regulator [Ignavibacteria bacterium]|nr:response regulator [Ignavibacteria bacterium]
MSKADILIVEDDKLTASVLRKYLEKNNYNVTHVIEDGLTAVEKALLTKPDLILMDIFLKDSIDGIEVARRIKTKVDIPVIFLTADSSSDTIQRAKITEPFGYLVKPVDSSVLMTNIDLTLRKQISYNKKIMETLQQANDELERRVNERTNELFEANEVLKNEIAQRKLAEEELRKADTLATIGKMSAVLAHEIRNPLNSIKINADILHETAVLTENQRKRIKIIRKEVERLNNLVKDVLMFSRQSELVLIDLSLKNLIDGLYQQMINILEEKKIDFKNSIGDVRIKGDFEKLKQVFLNLILNSIDAIFEDGRIEISSVTDNGSGKIYISVTDNGCGVANPDKMFDPFYTSKNLGTGLGLSISQNIIKQHNGELVLHSSKPGETVFHIILPYYN